MTSPRYIVQHTTYGYAQVWDTENNIAVFTNSGRVYEAPIVNAQWTADMLNRKGSPEPTPEPVRDLDGGDFDPTDHEGLVRVADQHAKSRSRVELAKMRRLERETTLALERQEKASARADRTQEQALRYARQLGKLEAQVLGLRAHVLGVLHGIDTLPDSYPELKAELAVEKLAEMRNKLDSIIEDSRKH